MIKKYTQASADGVITLLSPAYIQSSEATGAIDLDLYPSPSSLITTIPYTLSTVNIRAYDNLNFPTQDDTDYPVVASTGGLGTGMIIRTSVVSNRIAAAIIQTPGTNYSPGEVVQITMSNEGKIFGDMPTAQAQGRIQGYFATIGLKSFSATGGSGSGFQATFVITKGIINSYTITAPGTGYEVGDKLEFNEWGSDFSWTLGNADVSAAPQQIYIDLDDSNFTSTDLAVNFVLLAGETTQFRCSKFKVNDASDKDLLAISTIRTT
mgnify:CR=1 FL=1